MTTAIIFALVTVAALLLTLARVFPFRFILGYATSIDVTFSVVFLSLLSGTLTGSAAAVTAGLVLALALTIGRNLFGYQRLKFVRCGLFKRRVEIVTTPPRWYSAAGTMRRTWKATRFRSPITIHPDWT